MLTAIKDNGDSLEHAHSSLKKDKDVVLAAIKSSGSAIEYADASFQKDKKIVLMAVSTSSEALDYADASLKKDKEIVKASLKQNGYSLQYADTSLKKDKEMYDLIYIDGSHYSDDVLKDANNSFKYLNKNGINCINGGGWQKLQDTLANLK